jgi:hypothetical protein
LRGNKLQRLAASNKYSVSKDSISTLWNFLAS